jgi:hypothetical protein
MNNHVALPGTLILPFHLFISIHDASSSSVVISYPVFYIGAMQRLQLLSFQQQRVRNCQSEFEYQYLLCTVTGWCHTKRPMHCGRFLIYCATPSEF